MATRHKRGGSSKRYFKVKLDLYFKRSESPEEENYFFSMEHPEVQQSILEDYNATVDHYLNNNIEDAVRQVDANEFVKYLYSEGRIVPDSAHWINGEFAVEFIVEASPTTTVEEVANDLYMYSLEDGEYESGDSNGWIIRTLNGEWEYGRTDYRSRYRIHVTPFDQFGGKRRRSRFHKSRKQRRRT